MSEYSRNQVSEAEKIDLMRIINHMWKGTKRYWIGMLVLIILCGGLFGFRAYRNYSPVYSASATFTINKDDSSIYSSSSYLNIRTAGQIVKTFPYILDSSLLQKKIAEELGTETVPGTITTETLGTTNMITIVVRSDEPETAYNILQAVLKHYPEVAEPVLGEVIMNLLDMTDIPESASNKPSYRRIMIKGSILGVMLCGAFLLIYAFTRSTIHEEEDFKKMLNVDCICTIPQIIFKKRGKDVRQDISIYNKKISQTFLEAIRVLRARIEKDAKKNDLKVFLVTSAAPGEGKSTIAANIAMALAMRDSKVVLVDCDLRNPSVREQLNLSTEGPGLYEYLNKKAEVKDILQWSDTYKMNVIPGGEPTNNASELLDSLRMHQLLDSLKGIAEYVILDTAPVGILTDTAVLAQEADAALFVVKQDCASRSAIMEGIGQLAESGIYVSGCILNGAQAGIGGYGYRNYRYYNRYGNYSMVTPEEKE
jgi:capsular exopolysaccharide synthesis family protein